MPPRKRTASTRGARIKKAAAAAAAAEKAVDRETPETASSQLPPRRQEECDLNKRAKVAEGAVPPRPEADKEGDKKLCDGEEDEFEDTDAETLSSVYSDTDSRPGLAAAEVRERRSEDGGRGGWAGGGYNAYKTFDGRVYTGMKVGGKHVWEYGPGVWKETKVEPDLWHVDFEVKKHRSGRRAPAGSGVPVGSLYHWYVVAHQFVQKVDDDTYTTRMTGYKYKLAHRRAGAPDWNLKTEEARRRREVAILEDAASRVRGGVADAPEDSGGSDDHRGNKKRLVKKAARPLEKGQATLESLFGKINRAKSGGSASFIAAGGEAARQSGCGSS